MCVPKRLWVISAFVPGNLSDVILTRHALLEVSTVWMGLPGRFLLDSVVRWAAMSNASAKLQPNTKARGPISSPQCAKLFRQRKVAGTHSGLGETVRKIPFFYWAFAEEEKSARKSENRPPKLRRPETKVSGLIKQLFKFVPFSLNSKQFKARSSSPGIFRAFFLFSFPGQRWGWFAEDQCGGGALPKTTRFSPTCANKANCCEKHCKITHVLITWRFVCYNIHFPK